MEPERPWTACIDLADLRHLLKREDRNERNGAPQRQPHCEEVVRSRDHTPTSVAMALENGFSAMALAIFAVFAFQTVR
jgi:hypothetical protein